MASINNKLLLIALLQLILQAPSTSGCFNSIFSFGDSTADTGNLVRLPGGSDEPATRPPYGRTYFHYPTGRYSDGRLIIDFIAQRMGLQLVQPYRGGNRSEEFESGANFAVTGACTMKNEFFRSVGIDLNWIDYSLATQLKWFKQLLLDLTVKTKADVDEILGNSLIIVGEMGVNDYMHLLDNGVASPDKLRSTYAPIIVGTVGLIIKDLINLGARTLMVSGMFPMGCMPKYLTMFQSAQQSLDPKTGCVEWLNDFSEHHNDLLKLQLDRLRKLYPRTNLIFADYYAAILPAYQTPAQFGISISLAACCGDGSSGGPYYYNVAKKGQQCVAIHQPTSHGMERTSPRQLTRSWLELY